MNQERCVLCGKPKEDGRKLIVGLHGAVCSHCVDLCRNVLLTGEGGSAQVPRGVSSAMDRVMEMLGVALPQEAGVLAQLAAMTRELASPAHGQVILAEGNTSARDGETLWIKASGQQMPGIGTNGFVQVQLGKVVQSLDGPKLDDSALRALLNDARVDPASPLFPSTETFMHAWLLTLPGVGFVAHTHPEAVLGVMCGPKAREFAEKRFFPDQIVLCGPRSVFVPYCAPGFELAVAICSACGAFGAQPKTILLDNHGLISAGRTANEAMAACLMTEKAARVFLHAGDARALSDEQVRHIHEWTDEHYRQSQIWE